MKIYQAMIQHKGDIEMVYVATEPPGFVIDKFVVDFLYNNKPIFFYFYDEEQLQYYLDEETGLGWELIDYKYITEKISMEFEWFSKN